MLRSGAYQAKDPADFGFDSFDCRLAAERSFGNPSIGNLLKLNLTWNLMGWESDLSLDTPLQTTHKNKLSYYYYIKYGQYPIFRKGTSLETF